MPGQEIGVSVVATPLTKEEVVKVLRDADSKSKASVRKIGPVEADVNAKHSAGGLNQIS